MLSPRVDHSSITINDRIYVFGGLDTGIFEIEMNVLHETREKNTHFLAYSVLKY